MSSSVVAASAVGMAPGSDVGQDWLVVFGGSTDFGSDSTMHALDIPVNTAVSTLPATSWKVCWL